MPFPSSTNGARPLIPLGSGLYHAAWLLPRTVITALAVCGCTLAPNYHRPSPPVAPVWQMTNAPGQPLFAHIGWREFFADSELQKLITTALANNRDLRIAASRVEEARYNVRIQGAALMPQVNALAIGGQTQLPDSFSYPGISDRPKFFSGSLGANWEIDFWGRLRNMRESARQDFLASGEARRAVATSLVAEVARTWLTGREYDERIKLAHRTVETRRESARIAERRYEVGAAAKLDTMQARAVLDEALAAVEALQQARTQNLNALTLLVGAPVASTPGVLQFNGEWLATTLPAGLPSDMLVNRPDILEAEHRLQGAHADIGAARAAFLPRVIVTGAGGTSSTEFNTLFGGGSGTWTFLPVISLPLFAGGRNTANLGLAEARRHEAVAQYEHTIQAAFREVADALAARERLTGRIRAVQDEQAALAERARLAQLRYVSGRSAYLEVLDAQRDLFNTEQSLVQLRRDHVASAVSLYEAVGGGFPDGTGLTESRIAGTGGSSDDATGGNGMAAR